MDRNARNALHQRQSRIGRRAKATRAVEFFNVLTSPELLATTEALLPVHRERLYPPTVALSMFMCQALEADGSCQKAVNGWAAQRAADGLSPCSVRTGGFCRARQRLPLLMISTLARETGRLLSQKALAPWRWRGRSVKLVDGTGISMPDTPENQALYPQPSTQTPGVGFPLARLVMVICLATGAALDAAIGPHSGKGTGELGLVRALLSSFSPGDVMLADALYCNYFLIATLMAAGVDVLFEQNGARITDFRRGKSLGTRDHIVHWPKPECLHPVPHRQEAAVGRQHHGQMVWHGLARTGALWQYIAYSRNNGRGSLDAACAAQGQRSIDTHRSAGHAGAGRPGEPALEYGALADRPDSRRARRIRANPCGHNRI